MTTQYKPLNSTMLILCLSGDLCVDPDLLVETIGEDQDLRRVIRSYAHGDFTYGEVLDTLKDIF